MKQVNDENIDEIMFSLLEGKINGKEREQLLKAIHADPAYLSVWNAWQSTVLKESPNDPVMDVSILKKKVRIVPLFLKYAVAAILIIGLSVVVYLNMDQHSKPLNIAVNDNEPIKPHVKSLPKLRNESSQILTIEKDTVQSLREKAKYMAKSELHLEKKSINQDAFIQLQIHIPETLPSIEKIEIADIEESKNLQIDNPTEPKTVIQNELEEDNSILVSISQDNQTPKTAQTDNQKSNQSLLSRLFGGSKIKIEDDEKTRTQKKIVIENHKYQIIAGF